MARLLLGVTGGIAAYKAIETARLAIRAGHQVRVLQTEASTRFVGTETFAAITGAPVLIGEFDADPLAGAYPGDPVSERAPISHLALVQRADAYLIAPASAETLAKLAAGHADSMVSTCALAAGETPLLIAPAMNDAMYRHPATQANLATLHARGVTVIGPESGELASHGERGIGRMSEPAALLAAVEATLIARAHDGAWAGQRVLVTAGGTREPIDSVRFIGNRSSGRMGFALAARAAARGAQVTLVAANVALAPPAGVRVIEVASAAELAAACDGAFADCDVLLMAAAVADFRPRHPAAGKLKKADGPPAIELEATADVLSELAARRRPGQRLVGFAAEHGPGALAHAREKLVRKRLDLLVLNDVGEPGIGFDAAENAVTVLGADGRELALPRASKERIADGILDRIGELSSVEEGDDVRGTEPDRAARV